MQVFDALLPDGAPTEEKQPCVTPFMRLPLWIRALRLYEMDPRNRKSVTLPTVIIGGEKIGG